jgi:hypothetical protein
MNTLFLMLTLALSAPAQSAEQKLTSAKCAFADGSATLSLNEEAGATQTMMLVSPPDDISAYEITKVVADAHYFDEMDMVFHEVTLNLISNTIAEKSLTLLVAKERGEDNKFDSSLWITDGTEQPDFLKCSEFSIQ